MCWTPSIRSLEGFCGDLYRLGLVHGLGGNVEGCGCETKD